MKISIIGSGWLAQPLAQYLQQQGHDLLLTCTSQEKIKTLQATGLNAITYQLGDQLSNPEYLFDTDVLIIAITSKDVEAFEVLMDQLIDQNCRHIIFISSTSVYANDQQTHDETSESLQHGHPLLQIEELIQTHQFSTILRLAGLVGPGRHPGNFFRDGKTIKSPDAPVNLIHLDDVIGTLQTVIENNAWNEVYNVCADTHPTKAVFYSQMALELGNKALNLNNEQPSSHKTVSNQKLKHQLGYQLIHPDVMKMTF
ncbi:MAG: NAD(P)-binding domain-containing protein [Marinicella sp.]|nr:NAD(P)-binding domain-containing protein [Xanthomonadales bacterium]